MFDKVCGTDKVRLEFTKTFRVESIRQIWDKDIIAFRKKVRRYLMY